MDSDIQAPKQEEKKPSMVKYFLFNFTLFTILNIFGHFVFFAFKGFSPNGMMGNALTASIYGLSVYLTNLALKTKAIDPIIQASIFFILISLFSMST